MPRAAGGATKVCAIGEEVTVRLAAPHDSRYCGKAYGVNISPFYGNIRWAGGAASGAGRGRLRSAAGGLEREAAGAVAAAGAVGPGDTVKDSRAVGGGRKRPKLLASKEKSPP